ncbi:Hypothetical protein SMAX5B_001456 [Scophthalmus maximus]|uniref:Uncharacterized protein n=1 Tax=Scophthalmus maximus TaxID=52904 RepID=A0A2U9B0W8_SCOMX|nr:Hypothetical protein SMAX5B_001456 [Scophthalmus maximus]
MAEVKVRVCTSVPSGMLQPHRMNELTSSPASPPGYPGTNKGRLIMDSRCRVGCAVSGGSAFEQLARVNKSDWRMSAAAPCRAEAVSCN